MIVDAKTVASSTKVEITTEDVIRQIRESWLSSIGLPPNALLDLHCSSLPSWVTSILGEVKILRQASIYEQYSESAFQSVKLYARKIDLGEAGGTSKIIPNRSDKDPDTSY